jgi:hypothetical protein
VVGLKPPLIPTIVSFTDINNPASATVIYATGPRVICDTPDPDPRNASGCMQFKEVGTQTVDIFAETLGPGYALASVTLEMVPSGKWPQFLYGDTGTPVTRGIEAKMPALMAQLRELDKSLQLVHPNDPLKVRSGHLSVR